MGNVEEQDLGKGPIVRQPFPFAKHLLWHEFVFPYISQHSYALGGLVSSIKVGLPEIDVPKLGVLFSCKVFV